MASALLLAVAAMSSQGLPSRSNDVEVSLPDPGTAVGDAAEESAAEESAAEGSAARRPLRCQPAGCEVWRLEAARAGRVAVRGDLAVHVGQLQVTGIDTDDGAIRWRSPWPTPDGRRLLPAPDALHLDDRLLVIGTGHELTAYDPRDGTLRWSHSLEVPVVEVAQVGAVTVVTSFVDGKSPAGGRRVDVFDAEGQLLWERETDGAFHEPIGGSGGAGLLVHGDADLAALDPVTGEERWSRPTGDVEIVAGEFGLATLDRGSGLFSAVDPVTGRTLATITVPGGASLQALGPWVGVDTGEELHVLAAPATTVLVRDGRWTGSDGISLPTGVYVSWMGTDRSAVEVARYTHAGELLERAVVPTASRQDTRCCADLEPIADGWIRLTIGGGRQLVELRVDTLRHRNVLVTATSPGRAATTAGDLVVVLHEGGRLEVVGPAGTIRAFGTDRLVSRDPLMIHGAHGLLRLDDRLVSLPAA